MSTTRLIKAKIIKNHEVAPGYFILGINSSEIASLALPGQFAHISCGDKVLLRRPFSFYKIEKENIFFLYQVSGKGTGLLKKRLVNEEISILGPLGRGFWFENNGKKKIIIAGGVGIAPFPFVINEMVARVKIPPHDIVLIYGVRSKEFLVGVEELQKSGISVYISTENGNREFKGTATDLLLSLIEKGEIESGDYFTCGPEIMMNKIVKIAKRWGARVEVCLEERMACGIGACLSCVRKINGKYLRVCKDGPVFWGDEVEW